MDFILICSLQPYVSLVEIICSCH